MLNKIKIQNVVQTLRFDDSGRYLFVGTKSGAVEVLEVSREEKNLLQPRFKVQLAHEGVTSITYVPAIKENPPCLLVNTPSDSSATIVDCVYGGTTSAGGPLGHLVPLTNLIPRHRVRVAHSLLPLKNCFSSAGAENNAYMGGGAGGGYMISGGEQVFVASLNNPNEVQHLNQHLAPVVAVATNAEDTVLASADARGRIVLWRRTVDCQDAGDKNVAQQEGSSCVAESVVVHGGVFVRGGVSSSLSSMAGSSCVADDDDVAEEHHPVSSETSSTASSCGSESAF